MTAFEAGQTVGRYRILRPLGSGAMGVVYLAQDPHIERFLAIKTVRVADPNSVAGASSKEEIEERTKRLLREAKTAGRLIHPNIVTLFDAGEETGTLFLAFEYVEGESLAERLHAGPPLTVAEALRIARETADGLDCAHRLGIVHRDIKPANLMLTTDGRVKISDFGIAKMAGQATELTVSGSVVGSPQYLSPEQIRGQELDGRSDLFSLGVVLYELVGGRRPFGGDTFTTLLYKILHEEPEPIRLRPGLDPDLAEVLARLLAKDREARFANAAEAAAALAALERGLAPEVLAAPATLDEQEADGVEPTQVRPVGEPAAPATRPGEATGEPQATRPPPPPVPPVPAITAPSSAAGSSTVPPSPSAPPGPSAPPPGSAPQSTAVSGAVPGTPTQLAAAYAPTVGVTSLPRPARPSRRKLWIAVAAVALVLLVGAVVAGVLVVRRLQGGGDLVSGLAAGDAPTEQPVAADELAPAGEALPDAVPTAAEGGETGPSAGARGADASAEPSDRTQGGSSSGTTGTAGSTEKTEPASSAAVSAPPRRPPADAGGRSEPSTSKSTSTSTSTPAPAAGAAGGAATRKAQPGPGSDVAAEAAGDAGDSRRGELSPEGERPAPAPERRPALRRTARELIEARKEASAGAGAVDETIDSGLQLAFHVEPAQAFVLVDGTVIGRAAELDPSSDGAAYRLPGAGDYLVKLRAPGMKDHQVLVRASASGPSTTTVTAHLAPAPVEDLGFGDLKLYRVSEAVAFEVSPPIARLKARVLVDGRAVGRAAEYPGRFARGNTWLQLGPGRHRVSVVAPGFARLDVAVDVSSGAEERRQRIEIVLQPERSGAPR